MIRIPAPRAALMVALCLPLPTAFAQTSPSATNASASAAPALPAEAAQRMEQHSKQLHDQLGITPAEESLWDQFSQVMTSNAAAMSQAMAERGAQFAAMNAADNMQSYAKLAQVHAENMQRAAAAFQPLYAALSPEQKRTADEVFRNRLAKAAAKR